MTVETRRVGPEAAAEVLAVVRAAFADRPVLDPPADALAETEESIAALLAAGGGLLAVEDGRPVGALVLDPDDDAVYLRRVSVDPSAQGHGLAHGLVRAALSEIARSGARRVRLLAREELPRTIGFWRDLGFVETGRHTPYVEMARPAPVVVEVPGAEDMHDLGRRVAAYLTAGDVLVLSGELGAGKTTFAQGLGEGLGVRGGITSPTFVIARVHPSLGDGPELVHVDAYRLGGRAELDDLDLDTDLDEAVTVVEWGTGIAESLAEARMEVRISRATAQPDVDPDADPRLVELDGVGARWLREDLRSLGTRGPESATA
ncbi:tRNA (adenosine(37)-N6)-threonylcarbamoyltransferase complex ATPase subunit type 1 TsaE [Nocardioides albidus]|uniref:tRNA threonylcarbamoyladenosine biosynthesis protein TsaE n=1 Tax=Nocardioides albidus TaxID=1517589 RepID=A0A5C4VLP5_9ACTN|nr:tRNA (adenosine(37)-N6)-threonylcarbamoyltransferase complex ATPase subunit type 1 TsaE [Nocardioides albidus]TNM36671.1 tRNA (adenosine(37)-N6)-threonylcarbamoyltransferase complex ATPase subunit type 1 TsaE [Nocardioides albidus]